MYAECVIFLAEGFFFFSFISLFSFVLLLVSIGFSWSLFNCFMNYSSILIASLYLLILFNIPSTEYSALTGTVFSSTTFWLLRLALTLFVIIFLVILKPRIYSGWRVFELHLGFLVLMFTFNLLFIADSWLLLFLLIELYNIVIYAIISFSRTAPSTEASFKYFVFGSFSSGLLLFGLGLLYLNTGNFAFTTSGLYIEFVQSWPISFICGLALVILSLLFKIGLPPFHLWLLDVYKGVSFEVLYFLNSVVKFVFFVLLAKFILTFNIALFITDYFYWLLGLVILTFLVGFFGAVYQARLKPLLIYASVYNTGFFMLFLLFIKNSVAFTLFLVFTFLYIFNLTSLFTLLLHNSSVTTKIEQLSAYKTFEKFLLTFSLVSLVGIPPLLGFFSKFLYFFFLSSYIYYFFLFLCVLLGFIAAFYYIRLVKLIYFVVGPNIENRPNRNALSFDLLIALSFWAQLCIFLFFDDFFLILVTYAA